MQFLFYIVVTLNIHVSFELSYWPMIQLRIIRTIVVLMVLRSVKFVNFLPPF